jgi:hypothetical protein
MEENTSTPRYSVLKAATIFFGGRLAALSAIGARSGSHTYRDTRLAARLGFHAGTWVRIASNDGARSYKDGRLS